MGNSRHEGARPCSKRQSNSFNGRACVRPSQARVSSCVPDHAPLPSAKAGSIYIAARKALKRIFSASFFAHLLLPRLSNFCVRSYPLRLGLTMPCSCLCATARPGSSLLLQLHPLPMDALTCRYEEAKEKSTMDYFYALYHLDQARPTHTHPVLRPPPLRDSARAIRNSLLGCENTDSHP